MPAPAIAFRASLPVTLELLELRPENDEMVTLYFPLPDAAEAAARGLDLAALHPGQFFMVWLPRLDEKPYAVSYLDGERLGITVQRRGPFSTALHRLQLGARVGLRGPFGRGFWGMEDLPDLSRVAVIGGGCGTAVLAPLARALRGAQMVQGARTAGVILRPKGVPGMVLYTDDGSAGTRGFPTEWLEGKLAAGALDMVYTCGPEVMMAAVVALCREAGVACQACLERYMKCGIGVCGQCECDGLRVCVEGPTFSGEDLAGMPSFGRVCRDATGHLAPLDHCPTASEDPPGCPGG